MSLEYEPSSESLHVLARQGDMQIDLMLKVIRFDSFCAVSRWGVAMFKLP